MARTFDQNSRRYSKGTVDRHKNNKNRTYTCGVCYGRFESDEVERTYETDTGYICLSCLMIVHPEWDVQDEF